MDTAYKDGFTHAGKFHADDVFSAALLNLLFPGINIHRVQSVPAEAKGIVFDIGLKEYDHHQPDSPVRDNGIAYAAFGLLWRTFGGQILGEEEAARFDARFIQPLDLNDNTGAYDPIADVIDSFNPTWNHQDMSEDEAFHSARILAQTILEKQFEKINSHTIAYQHIVDTYSLDEEILVLSQYLPWEKAVENTPVKYVILPSKRGGYSIRPVSRKDYFPEPWRGCQKELASLTQIPSARFCHKSGFLCAVGTLEDAKKLCLLAMSEEWKIFI